MRTVYDLLADYLLTHELSTETADYYRRMVGVLCTWSKRRVPLSAFTPDLLNRLLLDKQRSGLTSHYRKSLRSALRALLSHHFKGEIPGKVRPVRVDSIVVEVWSAAEVQRIIGACQYMRDDRKRRWWRTIIAAAYYTGLSVCDLWTLRPSNIDTRGIVSARRSKTGKPISMRLPEPWLTESMSLCSGDNPIWDRPMAKETFRQIFARIVRKAGLSGSFKKLRKSCGTSVEMLYPGRGHIALGNTRQVFERHYFSRRQIEDNPMGPDELPPAA